MNGIPAMGADAGAKGFEFGLDVIMMFSLYLELI
jgi:hypothetical protein